MAGFACLRTILPVAQLRRRRKLICLLPFSLLVLYLMVSTDVFVAHYFLGVSNITIHRKRSDLCSFKSFELDVKGWTKFPLIMPYIEPNMTCHERQLFMAVVVNSGANHVRHRESRAAIRRTWGRPEVNSTLKWRLFFSLGETQNVVAKHFNKLEALLNNDIIIGNFTDNYQNIIYKTFMSHFWAFLRLNCKFILKTDDDVYVRVPWLTHWLNNVTFPRVRFYGGYIEYVAEVWREPGSKWYITEEQYEGKLWPPFAHGSFQVVSTDILPEYFNYTQFRKPFHADDAFFGVAARDLGVHVSDIPGFCFIVSGKFTCELKTATAICHDLSPERITSLHETYNYLKKTNVDYL